MEQWIEKFLKAPSSVKWGGAAGLLVLLTALNFFFMIQPADDLIEQGKATQRDLDTKLAEKTAIAQNLNEQRLEMDRLERDLGEALTELPETANIDGLLAQLNDSGKKAGLEIAKVEPQPQVSESFFARIPIKMAVIGNFQEIAMFFQEIANMRRIVNVSNIKLGTPVSRSDKVILQAEFIATTFRFVDAAHSLKAGVTR